MYFKIHFYCGNLPLCGGVIAFSGGPKSHTLTVILADCFPPSQDGVINREKACNCRRRLFLTVCDSIQVQRQDWISMKLILMALLDRWLV